MSRNGRHYIDKREEEKKRKEKEEYMKKHGYIDWREALVIAIFMFLMFLAIIGISSKIEDDNLGRIIVYIGFIITFGSVKLWRKRNTKV